MDGALGGGRASRKGGEGEGSQQGGWPGCHHLAQRERSEATWEGFEQGAAGIPLHLEGHSGGSVEVGSPTGCRQSPVMGSGDSFQSPPWKGPSSDPTVARSPGDGGDRQALES